MLDLQLCFKQLAYCSFIFNTALNRLAVRHCGKIKSYLNIDPLDDTGNDMEHLHFSVTLCHLLQQLEKQPEDRL